VFRIVRVALEGDNGQATVLCAHGENRFNHSGNSTLLRRITRSSTPR
jgi:hypothetical protein